MAEPHTNRGLSQSQGSARHPVGISALGRRARLGATTSLVTPCVLRTQYTAVMNDGEQIGEAMEERSLVVSVADAGVLLGVSRALAYELVRRGVIPSVRLGRRIVVPRCRLMAMLEAGSQPAELMVNASSVNAPPHVAV